MRILKVCYVILSLAVLLLTTSCSDSKEQGEENVIKETQDKVARDMTNSIKDPIDKAKSAGELINKHNHDVEEGQ